jgi:hypothetical protein
MFQFFRKRKPAEYIALCRWIDSADTFTVQGYGAGLASLAADPCIEILSVTEIK